MENFISVNGYVSIKTLKEEYNYLSRINNFICNITVIIKMHFFDKYLIV